MAFAIVRVLTKTVTSMQVLFNDDVDENIGVSNVSISTTSENIPNPEVKSVSVENDTVSITFQPLFPNVLYQLIFASTSLIDFKTVNGDIIAEDGTRNAVYFSSPGEDESEIRDSMLDSLPPVYEIEEQTLVRSLVTSMAGVLQTSLDVLSTTKSGNYLSVLVEDELITRDSGPIDKLDNGGAYEILRVASGPTGVNTQGTMQFDEERYESFKVRDSMYVNPIIGVMTADPISLQFTEVLNEKVTDDSSLNNFFEGLRVKVVNQPVSQVISVTLKRGAEYIEYDLTRYGYVLNSNRYDTNLAGININLEDNEIILSSSAVTGFSDGFVTPKAGDEIYISYVYKKLGRNIDSNTVVLSTTKLAVRESIPALLNRFTLDHAPIVDEFDEVYVTGGVEFLSTQSTDTLQAFSSTHPAFTREIKYDITRLPATSGEYTINYTTGEVVVYGEDENNDGTGDVAPVANYRYRNTYIPDLDFTFNSDRDELAINSTRGLTGIEAKIYFEYEDVFAPGTDYIVRSHVEVLNERVNNKLVDDFKISVDSFPVTNVFRILNETTGELYSPLRFNDTTITFSGRKAPRQREKTRERSIFARVPQEVLLIEEEMSNTVGLRILKINLEYSNITDSKNNFIGANFDTSMLFSSEDVFIDEFFYEDDLFDDVDTNLDRLEVVGDYCVDYKNGIVYVAVSSDQGSDLGDVSYQHGKLETRNRHILGVSDIYKSNSASNPNIISYSVGNIADTTVTPVGLEQIGERFVNDNVNRTLIVGTHQSGEDGITTDGSDIFTSHSGIFTEADIGKAIRVGAIGNPPIEEVVVTGIINSHQATVSPSFSFTKTGRIWVLLDTSTGASKTLNMNYDIVSVRDIYLVSQLGSRSASELDGYYDINRDSVSGSTITLGSTNPLQVGDAVIVSYNYGNIYADYTYLMDELVVSYEYGNNSLDWSISDSLITGQEYYVTYKYGALRDFLLSNFGAMTQIPQLTNFSPNLNRELYRNILGGTIQSFTEGPTLQSIERLVESFTDVTPNIVESVFENWVLGRDYLTPRSIEYNNTATFDLGRFNNGIVIDSDQTVQVPAVSHLKLNEGTIEAWVRPQWDGLENDSTITFDLTVDGYSDTTKVYIGYAGVNPSSMPFTLSSSEEDIEVTSQPINLSDDTGFFIWYDETGKLWHMLWREEHDVDHVFAGTISTTGEFFNLTRPVDTDGYSINESTDVITSTIKGISFEAYIDGYDAATATTGYAMDGISFASGDEHYIFDMAYSPSSNRVSLFKDGTGYLNFQVYDNANDFGIPAGFFNLSTNIRDWVKDQLYHVAASWKFNSADEQDEMHLFLNGYEVPNLFKFGGNPKASASFDFGDVAEETVIASASKPIINGFDGISNAGLDTFVAESQDFYSSGVQVGDSFYLLDETPDGEGDPNYGAVYTITGVGSTALTLDRALTLSLADLSYSVNKTTATITTPVNFQDFIVIKIDSNGDETELNGVVSDQPDYSVRRGSDYSHVIEIHGKVDVGESVVIKPLGLIFRRCREQIHVYGGGYSEIRVNAAEPVTLNDVRITSIILPRRIVETGGGFGLIGTVIGAQLVTLLQSRFTEVCQPSNDSAGRRLNVRLSGDNINYNIPGNQVIIEGTTYSGAISETIMFGENDTVTTSEYWTEIDSILVSIIPIDAAIPAGIIEVREYKPVTESENNGDFAEVVSYDNGIITLETYGTGGDPYILNSCRYEIDYPSFLKIRLDKQPDTFFIGSDYNGQNVVDATIDEFRILDSISEDTRIGETISVGERSVTTDYTRDTALTKNNNTLLLLDYDDATTDSSDYIDRFGNGFEVAPSVNDDFGVGIKFSGNKSFVLNNAQTTFNNSEGTIEFWINPLLDTGGDPNYHYYVDMTSVVEDTIESTTSNTVTLTQKARSVESVRLSTDTYNIGTNYFLGGSLSNVDSKTITLGVPLPVQNIDVKIRYVPIDSLGDRVSLFRDPHGYINFFVKASGVEHLITVHTDWERHTWHRVMAMWKTNSADNLDRLRLFVDGNERGTIKYGTGLIYGTGVLYGQAEIRPGVNRFLVDNIDLGDTFSKIYIGTDVFGAKGAEAIMDNLRFSEEQRLQSIKITSTDTIDINYTSNDDAAIPVVEDALTTYLENFDRDYSTINYLATIIDAERGIFRFEVEVIDSFDKVIGNSYLENLLISLINTIKPAHCESIIKFTK